MNNFELYVILCRKRAIQHKGEERAPKYKPQLPEFVDNFFIELKLEKILISPKERFFLSLLRQW